jgi:hypothetical protein
MLTFSWDSLPSEIKERINAWVEDIHTIVLFNPSLVYTQRVIESIENSHELYRFTNAVFSYFLEWINIYIAPKTSKEYVNYICKKIILTKVKSVDISWE